MNIFVNGQPTDVRVLLYESSNELLQLTKSGLLALDSTGRKIEKNPNIIEIEDKGKDIVIHIEGKKFYEMKGVKRYDFS